MQERSSLKHVFTVLFLVLTVLCWCPLGYGRYGEVERIMGMPAWATLMLLIGAVLFVIEWIYLFKTDFALYDHELEEIVDALAEADNFRTATDQPIEEEV